MDKIKQFLGRPQVWGTLVSLAVMAALATAFFYPDSIEGNTLQQHDVTQGIANGEEARAWHEATGETTRWTNSLFGGMPTFQIAPSYPADPLFKWINTVYSLGLPGPSGLLMMMMLGMYILMMVIQGRWQYSLLAAVAWGFSSYFIILIGAGHLWKFLTLTYVPPMLGGIILAYRGRLTAGGAMTAVAMMMQLLSNHVQMTYYFLILALLLSLSYLVEAVRRRHMARWCKATAVLAAAAALAVGANAPNLYNTWKYTPLTIRGSHTALENADGTAPSQGLDRDYLTQYSYGVGETWTLAIPNVKGGATSRPVKGHNETLSVADIDGAQEVIERAGLDEYERFYVQNYVTQYFGEPEGTNGPVYVGALICALFLMGCFLVKGPLKWALLAGTLLSIALAWGRNFMTLTDLFIDLVPGYNRLRTPESILVVAQLCMPVLGVMGLARLLSHECRRRVAMKVAGWSFGLVALAGFAGWVSPGIYGNAISQGDRQLSERISQSYLQAGYDRATVEHLSIANPRIAGTVTKLRHKMVSDDSLATMILTLMGGGILIFAISRTKRADTSTDITATEPCENNTDNSRDTGRVDAPAGAAAWAVAALTLLTVIDLYHVDKRYVSHECFIPASKVTPGEVIPATAADRALAADTTYYRVMPMEGLFSSAIPSYRHHSLGGYHAAKLTRYNDVIGAYLAPFAGGDIDQGNYNVVNMLNGRYLITADGRYQPNDAAMGNAWLVDTVAYLTTNRDELQTLGSLPPTVAVANESQRTLLGASTAAAPGDTIALAAYGPDRLTYNYTTHSDGRVAVFSEVWFPWGWEATVDGEPVEIARANYLLRGVRLPAGNHTLVMEFKPRAMAVTGTLSVISAIMVLLWGLTAILLTARKKKTHSKTPY